MVNGERRVRIIGWENILCERELPKEYLRHYPNFYTTADTILCMNCIGRNIAYKYFHIDLSDKVASISIEDFQYIVKTIHEASKCLRKINKRNKEHTWSGKENIEI